MATAFNAAGLSLSFIARLLRPSLIKQARFLRRNPLRPATKYLTRADTDLPPTQSNPAFEIFKSPSLPSVIANAVKLIKRSASSASCKSTSSALPNAVTENCIYNNKESSKSGRFLWTRVRIAAGVNLNTAEDIATFVDELCKHDKAALASMQTQLEDLFLRYLRLGAPDSGVALSFLHAIDPSV